MGETPLCTFKFNLRRFAGSSEGTTAIEYALIASGISIAIIGGVSAVGNGIMVTFYNKIALLF
jgi:pilus assembly protein Flp/PilA